jgi:hypothetical protein
MNDPTPDEKDPKALLLEREMARFQSGIRNLLLREARREHQTPEFPVDSEVSPTEQSRQTSPLQDERIA